MDRNDIKIFTLFSGYESQMMALKDAAIKFHNRVGVELVGWSELDSIVQVSHNLAFPEYKDKCHPDATKIDWRKVEDFDILMLSSPCQTVSRSGSHAGIKRGTGSESELIWASEPAIAIKRPKWVILENVEGILDPKYTEDWIDFNRMVASYGYTVYFKVLCAADYGVPQNRRRTFLVAMRNDDDVMPKYDWPEPIQSTLKPEDLLSDQVDDKYYLTVEETDAFVDLIYNAKNGYVRKQENNGLHPSKILSSQLDHKIQTMVTPITKNEAIHTLMTSSQGKTLTMLTGCRQEKCSCVIEVWEGKEGITPTLLYKQKPSMQTVKAKRECPDKEHIITLIESLKPNQYLRIRRLTPTECLRFMGVKDLYINRMLKPYPTLLSEGYTKEQIDQICTSKGRHYELTDYALYGRAGNSIVVDVLTVLFTKILETYAGEPSGKGTAKPTKQMSLAERKRIYARNYYERHKDAVRAKSREYHRKRRESNKHC